MKQLEVSELLKETGVIMQGHFLLTSGRHSGLFLQCARLLQHPDYTEVVCRLLAGPFQKTGIETVVGPAMGGVILAYETARQLGARAIYAEKSGDRMVFKRGFRVGPGEKVLVVEDAVTTGGSVRKVLDLVRDRGAAVAGAAVIVDRTGGKLDLGVPLISLVGMETESYLPENCPLCDRQIPLQKPKS